VVRGWFYLKVLWASVVFLTILGIITKSFCIIARDSIYAKRAYAIAIPSVRPSVTRVIHAKMVVARIVQFSPYSSPIPLVFAR